MTARKALTHLIDAGVFVRRPYGRLELAGGRTRADPVASFPLSSVRTASAPPPSSCRQVALARHQRYR